MTHNINSDKFINMNINDILQQMQKMGINYTKAKGSGAVISCQRCLKFTLLEIFTITKTREEGLLIGNKLRKLYM